MSGQGFIPYDWNISSLFLSILNKFDHVSVRDFPSYQIIKNLNSTYHDCILDDTFLYRKSPLSKDYIPFSHEELIVPFENNYCSVNRLIVCIQNDISDININNYLYWQISKIVEQKKCKVYVCEFLPKHDLQVIKKLKLITDVIIVPFEDLWCRNFVFLNTDLCIGTRFHFHLLSARCGAKGIFGSADKYYGIKHDSLLDIGSRWENVDLHHNDVPVLENPVINEEKLVLLKHKEFKKIMSLIEN